MNKLLSKLGSEQIDLSTKRAFCFSSEFLDCLFVFRAAPTAYWGSQARGQIGAVAAGLCHSHSNTRSLTHWARLGIEPTTYWFLVGFVSTEPQRELLNLLIGVFRPLTFLSDYWYSWRNIYHICYYFLFIALIITSYFCLLLLFCLLWFYFTFCLLGQHLQHMEVPRLGSNRSYSCRPTPELMAMPGP